MCRRVERGLYPGVELRGLLQETGVAADLPSAAEYLLPRCDLMAMRTRGRRVLVYLRCKTGTYEGLLGLQRRARRFEESALESLA